MPRKITPPPDPSKAEPSSGSSRDLLPVHPGLANAIIAAPNKQPELTAEVAA